LVPKAIDWREGSVTLLHLDDERLDLRLGGSQVVRRADPYFTDGALIGLTGLK